MSSLHGRILVTGGAGFIGSALIAELNRRGLAEIVVTDFLGTDEKWQNLASLKFEDYVEADQFRTRLAKDPAAFGRFSAVFHLGACSATTEKNAGFLIDNNFNVSKELAAWALSQDTRFIYASSAATYGDGAQGMADTSDDLHRFRPLNMYGYSKHLFDLYAQREGWLDRIVGLKYFNVYGPNEDHKSDMRSLVNKAYQQIQSTGRVRLFKSLDPDYKDGEQKRDFLYVKDAVRMTLHFADQASKSVGLFNLGSGEANTWITLTNSIFAALGRNPEIDFIDLPEILREKYQYFTRADISKLKATGFSHQITPLGEAVRDYVQNFLVPRKKLGE